MSRIAERAFCAMYPNANIRDTGRTIAGYKVLALYAGDYLCAEGLTLNDVYKRALDYEEAGLIKPDPNEPRTEF